MQRRSFIHKTIAGAGIAIAGSYLAQETSASSLIVPTSRQIFELPALPFASNALEPHIDKETMEIHHDKHHAAYIKNLNKEVESNSVLSGKSIEQILAQVSKHSPAVRNNAGGHYNHSLFWTLLSPMSGALSASLTDAINQSFGSIDKMKEQFNEAAKTRFGSGWAWIIYADNKLKICSTPNQDNPLMDLAEVKGMPILALDVWEHAYYLKYQNRRPDYISAFWNVVSWSQVDKYFEAARKK